MRPPPWLVVVLVGAVVGLAFAGLSTYDFVQHLDRQVHSLHCSFIPGIGKEVGESGCQVAMMSSYSSVFRTSVWGGIPISLPAMSVFAFIAFFAIDLIVTRRKADPRATAFLALACALPALASLVMAIISISQLGTACKLCVGIYVASAACLTGAVVTWRRAVRLRGSRPEPVADRGAPRDADPAFVGGAKEAAPPSVGTAKESASGARLLEVEVEAPPTPTSLLAAALGIGIVFVVAPLVLYLAMAPDHARFIGTCEALVKPDDTYGVMVRVDHRARQGAPAIEILDPLCPACRAFEERLVGSGFAAKLDRKAILFPLDNTCNWMVAEATHPGACTVSEAVLCAGDRAPEVIAWAFEAQEQIRKETKLDPEAAARIVRARFPELASCVGSPAARSRLNKSMRWAVANNIRILTPQLFVNNVKLCDEDVDLGLEYTLSVMLERFGRKALVATPTPGATPPIVEAMPPGSSAKPTEVPAGDPAATATPPADTPAANTPATDQDETDTPATDTSDNPASDKRPTDSPATGRPPADPPPADPPPADPPPTDPSASEGPVTSPSRDQPATDPPAADPPAANPPATKPPSEPPPPEPPAADKPIAPPPPPAPAPATGGSDPAGGTP